MRTKLLVLHRHLSLSHVLVQRLKTKLAGAADVMDTIFRVAFHVEIPGEEVPKQCRHGDA